MRKQLTYTEHKILGSVSKVISTAMLGVNLEVGNKDGRTKNKKILDAIDKAQAQFYLAICNIDAKLRKDWLISFDEEKTVRDIYHGTVTEDDLNIFMDFIRGYIKRRR